MRAVFKVLNAGFGDTIQDSGRRGFQDIGIPVSGPLDRISFRLANALVGNKNGAPALEMLITGPVLQVVAESVKLAVVGGGPGVTITGDGGHERKIPMGEGAIAKRGEVVRVDALKNWPSSYMAIEGGFAGAISMGSVSTYERAALGGVQGRRLATGDVLSSTTDEQAGSRPDRRLSLGQPFPAGVNAPIRVVMGPQDDAFTAEAKERFLTTHFSISPQSDRMGFRLIGEPLRHSGSYDLVSDGVIPGSIQAPGSGQPIVLMADCQTTGGYPKIATVISADLPLLGRRGPGGSVRFRAVSRSEAEEARREQEAMLAAWIANLEPFGVALNIERLYDANLVGGVQNALD